ncbi:hypothetical protein P9239_20295 [Caballeronia sp. LZ062]|uniref:hypothetical protein n=1 Tax=unclassified Caballeronia TaxID=2646786 RepID=UPI002860EC0C|nr:MULTISPECIES: hypothetical protein [unclassified Caballeronia]MDR5856017.1 hypothetical protein [Caballeronia sp. LZ050]MDR5872687.1 hypothetical protein [Caballeronia sp. LZ062]
MFSPIPGRNTLASTVGAVLCLSVAFHAQQAHSAAQVSAASASPAANVASGDILSAESLPPHFAGDDPEHVRDALAAAVASGQQAATANPSISSRVRRFLSRPFVAAGHTAQSASGSRSTSSDASRPDRTFVFVIPAAYGVRFESKKKLLSVNVSLAAPDEPGAILLKRKVHGQSGRKLVIAPEAKAKGFVQTIDTIELETESRAKTSVRGRAVLPTFDASHGSSNLAIVLVCSLEPPYLSDRIEHSDPTDEEPTDITRRRSTLHGHIDALWLVDTNDGTIVTRRLRLVK